MAKKFSELRDKMSPESRARSDAKAKEMLDAMAPASCSEVVERLAECVYGSDDTCGLDLDKAEKILHEWRERRVQELEPITKHPDPPHSADSASGTESSHAAKETRVDEAFVESVEDEVGMGRGAWDTIDAKELCQAVLKIAREKAE